jgi:SOS-response transcriptional repressor LexA
MAQLSNKQIQLLDIIKIYSDNDIWWLTIDEIKKKGSFESLNETVQTISELVNMWYIDEDYNVIKEIWDDSFFHLPFYGFAQCGNYGKEILSHYPREKFTIHRDLVPNWDVQKFFIVRAKWDSMEPFIESWDNILVQQQPSYSDESDLLLVIHNNKPKIKKIKKVNWNTFLVSLNKDHNDIELEEYSDDMNILWVVRKNLWNLKSASLVH